MFGGVLAGLSCVSGDRMVVGLDANGYIHMIFAVPDDQSCSSTTVEPGYTGIYIIDKAPLSQYLKESV